MGAWGHQPWDNDDAADWFAGFFQSGEYDARMREAFEEEDEPDFIRAACYILQTLGRVYVWPGEVDQLGGHLDRGIACLNNMLDPEHEAGMEMRDLWGEDEEVFEAIRWQLSELQQRRSEGNWPTSS